jgi:dipeptidyl aminopeptidase/acylaminoacyl peptidase
MYLKNMLTPSAIIINSIFCFSLMYSFPALSQGKSKSNIAEADYKSWGTLLPKALSTSGNWTSYQVDYDEGQDTLFVQSTKSDQIYIFPGGTDGRFIAEHYFVILMPNAKLHLLDLNSGTVNLIPSVKRYDIAAYGKFIITMDQGYGQRSMLKVYTEKGNLLDSIVGVTEYKLNEKTNALVFASNANNCYEMGIIHFEKYETQFLSNNYAGKFHRFSWQKNGRSIAYLTETDSVSKSQSVNFYNLDKRQHYKLDASIAIDLSEKGFEINNRSPLDISNDGHFVSIGVSTKKTLLNSPDKNAVEVWNGNDNKLFATSLRNGVPPIYIRWNPESGKYRPISSDSLPGVILNSKMTHALIFDSYAYGTIPAYYFKTDYYLKDISSGRMRLLLKQQSGAPGQITFSPKGDKIIYFSNKNWWVYDLAQDKHLNMTKSIHGLFDSESDDFAQTNVYGIEGWVDETNSVLIYDRYDVWMVALDGSKSTRLTQGQEKKMVFRIASAEVHDENGKYLGWPNAHFNLSKDILLDVESQVGWSTGFATYNRKMGVRSLLFDQQKYEGIKRAKSGFIYTTQKFNEPPRLMFTGEPSRQQKVLYQSNKQQQNFDYGEAQLIKYTIEDGDSLKAAIFYPAGYDASKKYPMLVYIYENVSKTLHEFVNVTSLNSDGFNVRNFTQSGYIVFMPDIKFKLGDPAVAASNCIISAVKTVIGMGIVIPNKIGLIGHSFGGYETNYAISQTGLFAAAVSGAGISDVIGSYFNLNENHSLTPDMWRYENQQQRMGKSLYDDKAGYLRNSPIMFADKINTPLLLWTGKSDRVVPMVQSTTMYLALRRLRKKTIFLAYPGEDHTLSKPANQIDLTKRIASWFDYYLKDEKPADWIIKGVMISK